MIKTFITICVIFVLVLLLIKGCDTFSTKNPISKFSKWWRTHIIGTFDENDPNF